MLDRPIIHHVINNLQKLGVEEVYVIVNFHKEKIEEYFRSINDLSDIEVHMVLQEKLTGIADAIRLVRRHVSEPFACILGDDITTGPLADMIELFRERRALAVQAVVREPNSSILQETCCVKLGQENRITMIEEKPRNPFSMLRGCGVYIFDDKIFDYIEKTPRSAERGEKGITDVIGNVASDRRAYGWPLKGSNFNVNTYEDLFAAWSTIRGDNQSLDSD